MTVIRVPPRQRTPIERHNLQTLNRANPSIKYKDVRKQSSVSSTEVSLAEIWYVEMLQSWSHANSDCYEVLYVLRL